MQHIKQQDQNRKQILRSVENYTTGSNIKMSKAVISAAKLSLVKIRLTIQNVLKNTTPKYLES